MIVRDFKRCVVEVTCDTHPDMKLKVEVPDDFPVNDYDAIVQQAEDGLRSGGWTLTDEAHRCHICNDVAWTS